MKYYLSLAILLFSFKTFSQETSKPLTDTEIMRNVLIMDIEGKEYENVKVTMKSISPDYFISDYYKVKVTVENSDGQKVWKKTLKNVYLYVFSNGQIQVGQQNFDKIVIQNVSGSFYGIIREKEGVYEL
ncbi:hypothetical protein [Reichenbachiella agariperforans]|uniref:hypothetical protein n=1 Tax=Reichenbachiella agariperforans TaxID=156994 RepID=UPI001C096D4B|nr:hypothetical protein [Reichenbachiella agariperforans]MBU2915998.1 hypothetical protein [Reichenbachiella agariperforans]